MDDPKQDDETTLLPKRDMSKPWQPEHVPLKMPFKHIGGDPFGGDNAPASDTETRSAE